MQSTGFATFSGVSLSLAKGAARLGGSKGPLLQKDEAPTAACSPSASVRGSVDELAIDERAGSQTDYSQPCQLNKTTSERERRLSQNGYGTRTITTSQNGYEREQ